jgi:hypothetical protein
MAFPQALDPNNIEDVRAAIEECQEIEKVLSGQLASL